MADNDAQDSGVSMVDVLEEEQMREEDANAVLGDSDDKNCTYPLGYAGRQALYACVTCNPACEAPAGVCLACSYECHEGHTLYELYTKRNFRCDCGNSRNSAVKCKLFPEKAPANGRNLYNQNFRGLYCTCSRPYPDPEEEDEDEMIQCVVCEDWFHGKHLGCDVPDDKDYEEMICQQCVHRCDFLLHYAYLCKVSKSTAKSETTADESAEIDVTGDSTAEKSDKVCSLKERTENTGETTEGSSSKCKEEGGHGDSQKATTGGQQAAAMRHSVDSKEHSAGSSPPSAQPSADAAGSSPTMGDLASGCSASDQPSKDLTASSSPAIVPISSSSSSSSSGVVGSGEQSSKNTPAMPMEAVPSSSSATVASSSSSVVGGDGGEAGSSSKQCRLAVLQPAPDCTGATLWPEGWRKELCTCSTCQVMYMEKDVGFLADPSDSITAYESRGRSKPTSGYERGMDALSKMDRVQQVEVLHEYNDLKSELTDYLKKFADNKKIVKEEDIKEFFSQLAGRKRQRLDLGYHCK